LLEIQSKLPGASRHDIRHGSMAMAQLTEPVQQGGPVLERVLESLTLKTSPKKDHVFRSRLPDIELPTQMTLNDYIFENVSDNLERVAIIDGPTGQHWTFKDTLLLSRKVAAGLNNLGIRKGDVIALLLPNCAEFIFSFLGAAACGAVVTTSNPEYTEREIAHQFNACETKLIITQAALVRKVQALGKIVVTTDSPPEGALPISVLFESDEEDARTVNIHPDNFLCIPFSSGTSGLPKGVILTHKSVVCNVAQQVDGENPTQYLEKEDMIISLLPMFHIYSLSCILLCPLRRGCAIVIMPKFSIPELLRLVQEHKITFLPLVPPIVLALAKSPSMDQYDLSSVKKVMCGAAPLGKELTAKFEAKLPNAIMGQGYGMTEAGCAVSISLNLSKFPIPVKSGSCGTIIRNTEAKIVDPQTGESCSYNELGELCIRGPQIMKGYLNDPEATFETIDKDGWMHTGDIALIDEDEELYIQDRLKELIKVKGFQVAPAELEALLLSHPSVANVGVVGKEDEVAGEVPVAFVVRTQDAPITEADVKEFISKQCVFYKRLSAVHFVDSIPCSRSGKILRKELRLQL
jgi:4-coumarate--CoA ligase